MTDLKFLIPKRNDLFVIGTISAILSFMFTIITLRFSFTYNNFSEIFIPYFSFISSMHILRLIIMKYSALKNAIQLEMDFTYINKYGFKNFERVNDKLPKLKKGIQSTFISISLFVLTLGFFVYPSIYKFKISKIPHLYLGSPQHHEMEVHVFRPYEVTDHRIYKVYQVGFFFYFVFAQLTEFLFKNTTDLYPWLISIVFYIGAFTLIPIPGSEGYELFRRTGSGNHMAHFQYPILLTMLFIGALSILVFESILFTFLAFTIAFIYVFTTRFWADLTGGHH